MESKEYAIEENGLDSFGKGLILYKTQRLGVTRQIDLVFLAPTVLAVSATLFAIKVKAKIFKKKSVFIYTSANSFR